MQQNTTTRCGELPARTPTTNTPALNQPSELLSGRQSSQVKWSLVDEGEGDDAAEAEDGKDGAHNRWSGYAGRRQSVSSRPKSASAETIGAQFSGKSSPLPTEEMRPLLADQGSPARYADDHLGHGGKLAPLQPLTTGPALDDYSLDHYDQHEHCTRLAETGEKSNTTGRRATGQRLRSAISVSHDMDRQKLEEKWNGSAIMITTTAPATTMPPTKLPELVRQQSLSSRRAATDAPTAIATETLSSSQTACSQTNAKDGRNQMMDLQIGQQVGQNYHLIEYNGQKQARQLKPHGGGVGAGASLYSLDKLTLLNEHLTAPDEQDCAQVIVAGQPKLQVCAPVDGAKVSADSDRHHKAPLRCRLGGYDIGNSSRLPSGYSFSSLAEPTRCGRELSNKFTQSLHELNHLAGSESQDCDTGARSYELRRMSSEFSDDGSSLNRSSRSQVKSINGLQATSNEMPIPTRTTKLSTPQVQSKMATRAAKTLNSAKSQPNLSKQATTSLRNTGKATIVAPVLARHRSVSSGKQQQAAGTRSLVSKNSLLSRSQSNLDSSSSLLPRRLAGQSQVNLSGPSSLSKQMASSSSTALSRLNRQADSTLQLNSTLSSKDNQMSSAKLSSRNRSKSSIGFVTQIPKLIGLSHVPRNLPPKIRSGEAKICSENGQAESVDAPEGEKTDQQPRQKDEKEPRTKLPVADDASEGANELSSTQCSEPLGAVELTEQSGNEVLEAAGSLSYLLLTSCLAVDDDKCEPVNVVRVDENRQSVEPMSDCVDVSQKKNEIDANHISDGQTANVEQQVAPAAVCGPQGNKMVDGYGADDFAENDYGGDNDDFEGTSVYSQLMQPDSRRQMLTCSQCKSFKSKLNRLMKDRKKLDEKLSEWEELENDSRLISQKLSKQLNYVEMQLQTCKTELKRAVTSEFKLKFQNKRLHYELNQRFETIQFLQARLSMCAGNRAKTKSTFVLEQAASTGAESGRNNFECDEDGDGTKLREIGEKSPNPTRKSMRRRQIDKGDEEERERVDEEQANGQIKLADSVVKLRSNGQLSRQAVCGDNDNRNQCERERHRLDYKMTDDAVSVAEFEMSSTSAGRDTTSPPPTTGSASDVDGANPTDKMPSPSSSCSNSSFSNAVHAGEKQPAQSSEHGDDSVSNGGKEDSAYSKSSTSSDGSNSDDGGSASSFTNGADNPQAAADSLSLRSLAAMSDGAPITGPLHNDNDEVSSANCELSGCKGNPNRAIQTDKRQQVNHANVPSSSPPLAPSRSAILSSKVQRTISLTSAITDEDYDDESDRLEGSTEDRPVMTPSSVAAHVKFYSAGLSPERQQVLRKHQVSTARIMRANQSISGPADATASPDAECPPVLSARYAKVIDESHPVRQQKHHTKSPIERALEGVQRMECDDNLKSLIGEKEQSELAVGADLVGQYKREIDNLRTRLVQAHTLNDNLVSQLNSSKLHSKTLESQLNNCRPQRQAIHAYPVVAPPPRPLPRSQVSLETTSLVNNNDGREETASQQQVMRQRRSIVYLNGPQTSQAPPLKVFHHRHQSQQQQQVEQANAFCSIGSDYHSLNSINSSINGGQAILSQQQTACVCLNELVDFFRFLLDKLHFHHKRTFELVNECQKLAMNTLLESYTHQMNLAHHNSAVMAGYQAAAREQVSRQQQQTLVLSGNNYSSVNNLYPVRPPPRIRNSAGSGNLNAGPLNNRQLVAAPEEPSSIVYGFSSMSSTVCQMSSERATTSSNNIDRHFKGRCNQTVGGNVGAATTLKRKTPTRSPGASHGGGEGGHATTTTSALQVAKQTLLSLVPIYYSNKDSRKGTKEAATSRQTPNQSANASHMSHHQQQQPNQQPLQQTQHVKSSFSEDLERTRVYYNGQLLDLLTRQNWCESIVAEKLKTLNSAIYNDQQQTLASQQRRSSVAVMSREHNIEKANIISTPTSASTPASSERHHDGSVNCSLLSTSVKASGETRIQVISSLSRISKGHDNQCRTNTHTLLDQSNAPLNGNNIPIVAGQTGSSSSSAINKFRVSVDLNGSRPSLTHHQQEAAASYFKNSQSTKAIHELNSYC